MSDLRQHIPYAKRHYQIVYRNVLLIATRGLTNVESQVQR